MATELQKIRVDFLSLVPKGANGKKVIYKADGAKAEGAEAIELTRKVFCKSGDEKRMVYTPVYSPDEVDSQGEFAKAEEIEAAAYGFMKSLNVLNVDANHDFDPKAAFVAESWIVKSVDPLFPKERAGTWCVGIKVEDPALWESVKKGELESISMAGSAVKIRKDEGGGILNKLEEMMSRLLKGERKESPVDEKTDDKSVEEFLSRVVKEVAEAVNAETDKKLEAFSARIEKIEKSTSGKTSSGVDGDTPGSHESCGLA